MLKASCIRINVLSAHVCVCLHVCVCAPPVSLGAGDLLQQLECSHGDLCARCQQLGKAGDQSPWRQQVSEPSSQGNPHWTCISIYSHRQTFILMKEDLHHYSDGEDGEMRLLVLFVIA